MTLYCTGYGSSAKGCKVSRVLPVSHACGEGKSSQETKCRGQLSTKQILEGEQVSRSFTDHRRRSIWTTAPRGDAVYELEGWKQS